MQVQHSFYIVLTTYTKIIARLIYLLTSYLQKAIFTHELYFFFVQD